MARSYEVIDDAMEPEFVGRKGKYPNEIPGDKTVFVPKVPFPGDRVWVFHKKTGKKLLRAYTVPQERALHNRGPDFELVALKKGVPPLRPDDVEILGVVEWIIRRYGHAPDSQ